MAIDHEEAMKEILENRCSVRSYSSRAIAGKDLEEILQMACRAPTAGNLQAYSIVTIKEEKTKSVLCDICSEENFRQTWIEKAPVFLVFNTDFYRIAGWCEADEAPFHLNNISTFFIGMMDTLLAAHNACLTAESKGIRSVYIGNISDSPKEVGQLLELPKYVYPTIMLCMGYPKNSDKRLTDRLPLEAVVHEEKYGDYAEEDIKKMYGEKEKMFRRKMGKGNQSYAQYLFNEVYTLELVKKREKRVLEFLKERELIY